MDGTPDKPYLKFSSRIDIPEVDVYLSPLEHKDLDGLVDCISSDPDIAANTLAIPSPYTKKDGENFLAYLDKENGVSVLHFAIRASGKKQKYFDDFKTQVQLSEQLV